MQNTRHRFISFPLKDENLLRRLDRKARALQVSRSAVIRLALLKYLANHTRKEAASGKTNR